MLEHEWPLRAEGRSNCETTAAHGTWNSSWVWVLTLCLLSLPQGSHAQTGTLAEPFVVPAPNAALHYQRGLLYLAAIDRVQIESLEQPVWQVVPTFTAEGFSSDLKRLLYEGRLALRSAANASRLEQCNFGINFREHGAATPLPHAQPMLQLARLLTLRGAYEQSRGHWEEAAVIYFDGLRMGRHMTHQSTVIEALIGLEILRNNFYALGRWAVDCPEPKMVGRAFGLFEALVSELTSPAANISSESSILRQRLTGLRDAYPDGPWAELILEDLGLPVVLGDVEKQRARAKQVCLERGVPAEVFADVQSFRKHLAKLNELNLRFTEAAAACLTLPPVPRYQRGREIFENFRELAGALGEELAIDPSELGELYAVHQAEATLMRLVLALGARRSDNVYPTGFDDLAKGFGDAIPESPYDGTAVQYETFDEGRQFTVTIAGLARAGAHLPQVKFSSYVPPSVD